jgi:glucosamine kinase
VAGGWGWLLGDEGGAVGLVREAARAVRASLDSGRPPDQLARALMRALGADEPVELGRKLVQAGSNAAIGRHAAAVFAAAEEDSSLARAVIRDGGRALALLVQRLVGRCAAGGQVVAGGGVITRQPALMAAFQEAMAENLPAWQVRLLTVAPVMGAVALAERILAGEECVGMAPTPAVART